MKKTTKMLTVKYSIIQAMYWGIVCAINGGFTSVFMLSRGFSNTEVGITIALGNILGVILQPIFASIADSSKKITLHGLSMLLSILSLLGFAGLFICKSGILVIASIFIFTLSLVQVLQPLMNSLGLYYINKNEKINFGLARGLGSTFFAITSMFLGRFIEAYDVNILNITGILLCVRFTSAVFILPTYEKDSEVSTRDIDVEGKLTDFLKKYKGFGMILIAVVIIFTYHGMCNIYLFQMIDRIGGNSENLGTALSIQAIVELPIMAGFAFLSKKISSNKLLAFSGIMFAAKAVSYIFATNVIAIYFCQSIQLLSYGLFIPASVFYVNELVDDSDNVKGQSFITSAMTLGNVFASLLGGVIIDNLGVYPMILIQASLACVGAILLSLSVKKKG